MEEHETERAEDPILLSADEVAHHLRVPSRGAVRHLIKRGDCPEPDLWFGNRPRWRRAKFFAWFEARAEATAAAGEEALDRDAS